MLIKTSRFLRWSSFLALVALLALAAACSSSPAASETTGEATGGPDSSGETAGSTDPVGEFILTGEMGNDRLYHAAVKLPDGRIMVVGGRGKGVSEWPIIHQTSEIYDPATSEWTNTGVTNEDRQSPSIALLPDGKVLLAGGNDNRLELHKTAEIWDPATGEWSMIEKMLKLREQPASGVLPDGRVIIVGGKS